jgi:hypothetical protein
MSMESDWGKDHFNESPIDTTRLIEVINNGKAS